jgi:hypothetical protein
MVARIALITISIIIFINCTIFSQCKFIKDEVDEFTGYRQVATKAVDIWGVFSEGAFEMSYIYVEGFSCLICKVPSPGANSISKNDECIIIFEDNSKINLKPISYTNAEYEIKGVSTFWYLHPSYLVTKSDLNILAEKNIKAIRFQFREGSKDYHPNTKGNKKIKEQTKCILKVE